MAMLTVLANDQAYLHAEVQAIIFERKMGHAPTEEEFHSWMDEWKHESSKLVAMAMNANLLEDIDIDEDTDDA